MSIHSPSIVISLPFLVESVSPQLSQSLVHQTPHGIEVLVRLVTQTKHSVAEQK